MKTAERPKPRLRSVLGGGRGLALELSDWSICFQDGGLHWRSPLFHGGLAGPHHRHHGAGTGKTAAIFKVESGAQLCPLVDRMGSAENSIFIRTTYPRIHWFPSQLLQLLFIQVNQPFVAMVTVYFFIWVEN